MGIELRWEGDGVNEKGICIKDERSTKNSELSQLSLNSKLSTLNSQLSTLNSLEGQTLVEVDPKYFRPAEVDQLLGDPSKAKKVLGWNPQKTSFEDLVKIMVQHDMKKVKKLYIREHMDE